MLQKDVIQSANLLPIEDLSCPLNAQILEFCESELFKEMNSNCCYEENSSYPTNQEEMNQYASTLLFKDDTLETLSTTMSPGTSSAHQAITTDDPTNNQCNYSVIFDDNENDISLSIDFNNQPNQSDVSLQQYHVDLSIVPFMGTPPSLPPVYEEGCLSAVSPYARFNTPTSTPSCSLFDHTLGAYLSGNLCAALTVDNPGILSCGGGLFLETELTPQELDFQGDIGMIFGTDTMQRVYNCTNELQAMCNESQHLVNSGANSAPLGPEISSLEDPSFKVGKLSVEERREKIHKYMKKRNERNFSKKIKYACRKTLADSRPRVRGRFAKNDELEMPRTSNHEEDTDEDVNC